MLYWQKFIAWLVALITAKLSREVSRELEAQALERDFDRLSRLRQKADKLRGRGHGDLAASLIERIARVSNDAEMFHPDDPASRPVSSPLHLAAGSAAPALPAPPAASGAADAPGQAAPASPDGAAKRGRGRPRKSPAPPATADGAPGQH
ncbi:MAG: hypothetical protein U0797_08160 [Gemmataceae bacterium]